jgi:UMF1 family MFS transporter
VPLLVAAWFAIFSVPALLSLRDRGRRERGPGDPSYLAMGLRRFASTLGGIRDHSNLVRFLLAYFFYNNAVLTIIVFAVAFSNDTLAFTMAESIVLVILMNVIAAPGAYLFGWIAGRFGAKRTIVITLVMWLAVVLGAETAAWIMLSGFADAARGFFWGVAVLASLCIGAIQANSRAFVGQLAPAGRSGEFYGFMAFAGKGSAVLGPIVFGYASELFDQRVAVGTIGLFFLIGLILMARVKQPARSAVEPEVAG